MHVVFFLLLHTQAFRQRYAKHNDAAQTLQQGMRKLIARKKRQRLVGVATETVQRATRALLARRQFRNLKEQAIAKLVIDPFLFSPTQDRFVYEQDAKTTSRINKVIMSKINSNTPSRKKGYTEKRAALGGERPVHGR
jgi:hypothetical protein